MVRTIVIGLDAATWDIIDPLLEEDRLPNIQKLIKAGSSGILNSTTPPMTPLAWTSIVTGVTPGKHNIYDFLEQDKNTYRISPTDYSKMSKLTIWDIYNYDNRNIGVVNFPAFYPPKEVNEFFISGIPNDTTQNFVYPKKIQDDINSTDYRIHPNVTPEAGDKEYFEEIKSLTDIQCDITIDLMERYDIELLFTVFMGIDWIQHYLWDASIDGENAVDLFYIYMDKTIGRLLDNINRNNKNYNIMILSDHGGQKIKGEIHLNNLLEKLGYLTRIESKVTYYKKIKNFFLNKARILGKSLPILLREKIRKRVSNKILDEMRKISGNSQANMHSSIKWEETTAFSYGYMGKIFIHRSDQYINGTVENSQYRQLRNELIESLEKVTHPETGEIIAEKVVPIEDIYSGEKMEEAPDILFIPKNWEYMIYGDFDNKWIHNPKKRIADHTGEGIFILYGDEIKNKNKKINIDITDVAPTLLYMDNLPILDEMDGKVLKKLFSEYFNKNNNPKFILNNKIEKNINKSESSNEQEIKDRLEDLGYI